MAFKPDAVQPSKFVPDAPAPKAAPVENPVEGASSYLAEGAKGVADAALSGASRVAAGVVAAPVALANRLIAAISGGNPNEAAAAAHDYVKSHFVHNATTPVGKEIGNTASAALAPVGESAEFYKGLLTSGLAHVGVSPQTTEGMLGEASDIAGTASAVVPVLSGAGASTEAANLAAQNAATTAARQPWRARGYRSAADAPFAAGAAGPSGTQALTIQNQQVGNTTLGAEAGVPHGTALDAPGAIERGRAPADAVRGRVAAALPTGDLSPAATQMVNDVNANRLVTRNKDADAVIDEQKQRLLAGNLTGPEIVDNIRALRQEGYARLGSEGTNSVMDHQVGSAQVQLSRALEQHVEDTLQPNANVTMDQWRQARIVQAKSSALQAALKGGNVDLKAIGRLQQADPGYLTGAFKDAADFANQHPKVAGLANNIEVPPSLSYDAGHALASGGLPQDVLSRIFGATGVSHLARSRLLGPSAEAIAAARQTPVAGLGGEFGPLAPRQPPPLSLSPSGGTTFEPHQSGAPLPQGPGVPYQEPLQLQQPSGTAFEPHQTEAPLPQGEAPALPPGTSLNPPPRGPIGGGNQRGSFSLRPINREVPGNGNETSGGASVEAFNRGTRNLVTWNGDTAAPISRDVNQIDRQTPPQGSVTLDADTGELVSSGNMPRGIANGLLSRWQANMKPVTDKVALDAFDEVQAGHPINQVLDRFAQAGHPRDILEHEIVTLQGLTQNKPLGQQFQ